MDFCLSAIISADKKIEVGVGLVDFWFIVETSSNRFIEETTSFSTNTWHIMMTIYQKAFSSGAGEDIWSNRLKNELMSSNF